MIANKQWFAHLATYFQVKDNILISHFVEEFLYHIVPFQSSMIIVYYPEHRPKVLYQKLNPDRQNNINNYLNSAYAFDPFYQRSRALKEAMVLRLHDIAPEGFKKSKYFESYYRLTRVHDEINFLVPLNNKSVLALAMERSEQFKKFTSNEIALLRAISPLITSSLESYATSLNLNPAKGHNHSFLHLALTNFGSSILSPREQQILQLLLRGDQSRDIARKLEIKYGTVKNHRLHIYEKMDIKNQSELFTIFLAAFDKNYQKLKVNPKADILQGFATK
ncbi:MAG: helix-turn-helix transcriptional regulator [Methylacidiphilales bacterium]|nr:helix-turn-helix transcriptional regulator [Candidatus Methylacidiphilales bacterium]